MRYTRIKLVIIIIVLLQNTTRQYRTLLRETYFHATNKFRVL